MLRATIAQVVGFSGKGNSLRDTNFFISLAVSEPFVPARTDNRVLPADTFGFLIGAVKFHHDFDHWARWGAPCAPAWCWRDNLPFPNNRMPSFNGRQTRSHRVINYIEPPSIGLAPNDFSRASGCDDRPVFCNELPIVPK